MDPRGIEPLPVCLQGNLAPLVHASPKRETESNCQPGAYETPVQPLHFPAIRGRGFEPLKTGFGDQRIRPLCQPRICRALATAGAFTLARQSYHQLVIIGEEGIEPPMVQCNGFTDRSYTYCQQ